MKWTKCVTGTLAFALLCVVTESCVSRIRTADEGAAVDQVRALDRRWADSYVSHDTAFANALLSDDILITSSDGSVKPRSGELGDIAFTPGWDMHFFHTTSVEVHVHGDAAVVAGLASWAFTNNGKRTEISRRYTATYVRGGKYGWRMIALQLGRAP